MTIKRGRMSARLGTIPLFVAVLGLAGCGGVDGVEFNGKLFEAVGMTGSLGGKKVEPKTEARAPLVLPPPTQSLPEPGSFAAPVAAAPSEQVWPNDPDKGRSSKAEALKQAQAAHCKDGNWKEKAMGDDVNAAAGPAGSCNGSIFSVLGKSLFGD